MIMIPERESELTSSSRPSCTQHQAEFSGAMHGHAGCWGRVLGVRAWCWASGYSAGYQSIVLGDLSVQAEVFDGSAELCQGGARLRSNPS